MLDPTGRIVKTPTMYNVTMTDADTEYDQAIPGNTKKILIKLRSGAASLKLAYVSEESGTNYITIPTGSSKLLKEIYVESLTLYFQSPTASQVAEIEVWK